MGAETKDRILYADILRTLTIIAVFIIHVGGVTWNTGSMTTDWYIVNTYMVSLRWCIPVFFMLSGIVILDPKYNLTFRKLYTKTLPRLICALIFWAIMYRILSPIFLMVTEGRAITISDFTRIYEEIFFGMPWHHLWFMYAIISVYILAPLLRVFTAHAKKEHYIYFLIIFFIFGSVIPKISNANNISFTFRIAELSSYSGYFILGYFFAKYDLTSLQKKIVYIIGTLTLVWTIASSTLFAMNYGPGTQYFENIGPHNVILAIFVFVLGKNAISNTKWLQKYQNNKWITLMANCSLGIYLVHDFFNIILQQLNITTASFPAILSTPLLAILVFLCSFGLVLIIRQIPVLNKWII